MLFEETINEYKDEVETAVGQLYDKAYQNQAHDTDLLLVLENGLKKDYHKATLERLKISPYQIGPDFIGLRYDTFYQFINYYRSGIRSKEEFLKIYYNQIRNAVAHSQYYFLYDAINLTNKDENQFYKLTRVTYDEWEIMFTKLMLLYNFLISNFNKYQLIYRDEVKDKHFGLLIYFPEKDIMGSQKTGWVKYDFSHKRWHWNQ